jgi:hypothetical protein
MKKIIALMLVLLCSIIISCKSQRAPGAPYDAVLTATPTPHYNLSFLVLSTQTPLAGATVVLVYPDATRTVISKTDTDGKVNFKISENGSYTAMVSHPSISFSNYYPLYNNYDVNNGSNSYTIIIDQGTVNIVPKTPNNISFTAAAKDYDYFMTYQNAGGMKRRIEPNLNGRYFSVRNFTTCIPTYIDAPGTSLTIKISLPRFWHGDDNMPVNYYCFEITASPLYYIDECPYAYADWLLGTKTAAAVTYDPYYGRLSTTIQLTVQNITMTNVCLKINKYEYYIAGQWVDHSYYGGTADYKIAGVSEDVSEERCLLNANNFQVSIGYPGYSGTSSTKGRLTLDFLDKTSGVLITRAIIQN